MVGWHHQLDGHEFEQTMGNNEGQGSLACSSPWGCKESDTTERLNNNKGLNCGTQDLPCVMGHLSLWHTVFSCCVWTPEHVGFSSYSRYMGLAALKHLVPRPGIKCSYPELQGGFLITGPPGKFLPQDIFKVPS